MNIFAKPFQDFDIRSLFFFVSCSTFYCFLPVKGFVLVTFILGVMFKGSKLFNWFKRATPSIAKFVCGYYLVTRNAISLVWCEGPSMEPTLYTNDFCLVEHVSAHPWRVRNTIQKNDIVLFRGLRDPQALICKRVVAVEGDELPEFDSFSPDFNMLTVPMGHFWVEGDNPMVSLDSRGYGPVPYGLVYGRILLRIWPNFRIF